MTAKNEDNRTPFAVVFEINHRPQGTLGIPRETIEKLQERHDTVLDGIQAALDDHLDTEERDP